MPVLLIAEEELPEEAYAEIADKMIPSTKSDMWPSCSEGGKAND